MLRRTLPVAIVLAASPRTLSPTLPMQDDRSSDDRSGFIDTADDAAEFEDSGFDDGGDAGFDDTDYV
jgi:hypothetical protein